MTGLRRAMKAHDEPMDELPTFEEFSEEQKNRLLRILSAITGSRAEAEDLAQESFTSELLRVGGARYLCDDPPPPEADPHLRGATGAPLPARSSGGSARVLAIVILHADVEHALELAAPIVDSIEFHAR